MSDLIRREDAITAIAVAVLDDRDELEAIKAIPSVQASGDLISRADAVSLVIKAIHGTDNEEIKNYLFSGLRRQMWSLPSAEAVSMEEHIKELNDLAVEWKAKFAKAETITDEIYDETMAKVAKECEECKERLRNLRPSAEAESNDLIIKGAKGIKDGLYNIKDGKLFQYKAKGGTVRTYQIIKGGDEE